MDLEIWTNNSRGQITAPARELTAAELNPVYVDAGYNQYPQPPFERYHVLDQSVDYLHMGIDGKQIIKDYGLEIGEVVHSAIRTYNEMGDIENKLAVNGNLSPSEEAISIALLSAKRDHFNSTCNIVFNYIDILGLIQSVQAVNLRGVEQTKEQL